MNLLNSIANGVDPMISFTCDFPKKHPENKIPILDLSVKLGKKFDVEHEFYEKPSKNSRVILASSAISWPQKRTIMTQEALRRLRNTNTGEVAQNFHLTNFMAKLKSSGYSEKFRHEIILSAKSAFRTMIEDDSSGKKPLYRNRDQIDCDKKVRQSKGRWWNKGTQQYKAVLFVPPTPNSELAKLMQKREAELNLNSNERIKIIEKGGLKISQILTKADPFPREFCDEPKCPYCHKTIFTTTPEPQKIPCNVASVGYRWECQNCEMVYEGETGRTGRKRADEHIQALRKRTVSSPLVQHENKQHPDSNPLYKITILKQFHDALSRQAEEGIRIYNTKPSLRINSKNEFNHPKIERVCLDTR